MSEQGTVTIVLLRNSAENFQRAPIRPNGEHDPRHLWSILFSQNGSGVLDHSFHEIGGLFRIPQTIRYSQGLTWTVAFDLMEKLSSTPEEKHTRECIDVETVIENIRDTASQNGGDYTRSIEYYVDDVVNRNGWPMYAWGSAYYWKKINAAMEARSTPTVYDLINSIHRYGTRGLSGDHDLDKLLAAYQRISPTGQSPFATMATQYFRTENLGQLLRDAESESQSLGCSPVAK